MTNHSGSEPKAANTVSPLSYPHQMHGNAYDEVYDEDNSVKPHWQSILSYFSSLRAERLDELQRLAQRILRDDGATYDLKNDPLLPKVWSLDIIPNTIDIAKWQTLETGLVQRAELFNLILQDIYGEQRLIREGIVPPEIIFNHPDFLRQCVGINMPGLKHLTLHATDLVRDRNGEFIASGIKPRHRQASVLRLKTAP